jgi:acyl-CoA thioester hydrolase
MDAELHSLLEGYKFFITLPLQWGDQDAMGHVNNTVYLRWFESARIGYGNLVGLLQVASTQKIGPILAAVRCNYRRQLRFPDSVHVGARVTRIGRSSFTMQHRVVSAALRAIAADGDSTIVTFDYANQVSVPVPEEIRQNIASHEGPVLQG